MTNLQVTEKRLRFCESRVCLGGFTDFLKREMTKQTLRFQNAESKGFFKSCKREPKTINGNQFGKVILELPIIFRRKKLLNRNSQYTIEILERFENLLN